MVCVVNYISLQGGLTGWPDLDAPLLGGVQFMLMAVTVRKGVSYYLHISCQSVP